MLYVDCESLTYGLVLAPGHECYKYSKSCSFLFFQPQHIHSLNQHCHTLAMYKITALITLGLLSLTASAFPQSTDEEADPVSCAFNETIGPNILVAKVEYASTSTA